MKRLERLFTNPTPSPPQPPPTPAPPQPPPTPAPPQGGENGDDNGGDD
jgi:hypothetical protein